jgi:hypothetical protein
MKIIVMTKIHISYFIIVVIYLSTLVTAALKYGDRCLGQHDLECEQFMKCINFLCLCDDSHAKFLNGRCVSKRACDSNKDCDDRTICFSGHCSRINLAQLFFLVTLCLSFAFLAFGINFELRKQKRQLRKIRKERGTSPTTLTNGSSIFSKIKIPEELSSP